MRTTLNLDDDVLSAIKELARLRGTTAGRVLSDIVREALASGTSDSETRNGVRLLPMREGVQIVTPEHVDALRDEA